MQEIGVDNGLACFTEESYLVLETSVVEPGLASGCGIHHAEQGSGDIDADDAPFESGRCEASQVGQHASTEAEEYGLARGALPLK